MTSDKLRRGYALLVRGYAGLILCFFAFVPGWILLHAIVDAISNPHTVDLSWIAAIVVCSALCYFLLLLAYRAFTGRGRRQDGGLLPPLALMGFAVVFGALAVFISVLGVYTHRWIDIVVGLVHFLAAAGLVKLAAHRRAADDTIAPRGRAYPVPTAYAPVGLIKPGSSNSR